MNEIGSVRGTCHSVYHMLTGILLALATVHSLVDMFRLSSRAIPESYSRLFSS